MQNFTPFTAAIGGILIGVSATLLWAFNGRTAGISTISGRIIPIHRGDVWWRLAFLVGLPIGASLGVAYGPALFAEIPAQNPVIGTGPVLLVVAGLLVGVGTRLGGGCTSGHGVCGLARLSRRSFVAVGVFMATGAATVFLLRHVL